MKNLKHNMLLMLLLLCNITSYAYDFEVDGLYYNLISASDKTCELVGCNAELKSVTIPQSVTIRGIELSVSSISPEAFANNTHLTKLQFNTPLEIPSSAFSGCTGLSNVRLHKELKNIPEKAFYNCPIDTLFIPNTVTFIGESSINLVRILHIEDGDTELKCGGVADSMQKLYLGRNLNTGEDWYYVGSNSNYYKFEIFHNTSICGELLTDVTIGPSVTKLSKFIFNACIKMQNICIPNNIQSIENGALGQGLHEIIIEDGENPINIDVSYMDISYNFSDYSAAKNITATIKSPTCGSPLEKVYIGRNIEYNPSSTSRKTNLKRGPWASTWEVEVTTKINAQSLFPMTTLKEIKYGPNVTSFCNNMFQSQKNVQLLRIPNSIHSIGDGCFANSAISELNLTSQDITIGNNAFADCTSLANITLNGMISLGNGCFSGCVALKTVKLGKSIHTIGNEVFKDCISLHKADLGGLHVLPQGSFAGCSALTWIDLGENLTIIERDALSSCGNLSQIGMRSITPPTFSSTGELSSVNKFNTTLYIPQGTTSVYNQANVWKEFLFKEENEIPEYSYIQSKPDDSYANKNMIIEGDLTGAIINQINASASIETLDLRAASIALDNQNAYYETGKRIDNPYQNGNDVDVYNKAPYYSYKYYTAPTTVSGSEREYSSSGKLINVITTCFCSDLKNAYLNGNLKSIKLPSSLTTLGEYAIKGNSLTDLYVFSTTPPTATTASFGSTNRSTCTLHVPKGCWFNYAHATGWKDFKKIIDGDLDNYIKVQPTNDNRKVILAREDDNAKYQWYKIVEKNSDEIDITTLLSSDSGWIITAEGWCSNMHDVESSAILSYEHTFNAGDVLSFDWSVSSEELFDRLQCYLGDELLFVMSGEERGTFSKTFDTSVSGKLSFVYTKDNIVDVANDNATIKNVKISNSKNATIQLPEVIANENSPELAVGSAEYGDKVFCIVTLGDDKQIKSDEIVFGYINYIKTQPTANNLCVELDTPDYGAKYQWYKYLETKTNSKTISSFITYEHAPLWEENAGVWTSINKQDSSSSTMYATIDVQEGDKLCFDWNVSSEYGFDFLIVRILWPDPWGSSQLLKKSGTDKGTYEKVFDSSSTFDLLVQYTKDMRGNAGSDCVSISNIHLARPNGFAERVSSKIEGATTRVLDRSLISEDCEIYCVVTLPNGRILNSDRILIGHNTAIDNVNNDSTNGYVVYNLNGVCIMKTNKKSELSNLPKGLYIVNGNKIVVK